MAILKRFLVCLMLGLFLCLGVYADSEAAVRTPKLNVKSLSLVKGSAYKLNVYNMKPGYNVEFESDNSRIIVIKRPTVKSCRLKAKAIGVTTVTATVYDENDETVSELECKVTVSTQAISVKFAKKRIKISEGTSSVIKTVIKPSTSKEKPRFTSDDPDIVTISSTGVITALSEGQTTIRAFLTNGKGAKCTVTVIKDKSDNNEPDATQTPAPSAVPHEHATAEPAKKPEKDTNKQ